jgi:hypothetical protein
MMRLDSHHMCMCMPMYVCMNTHKHWVSYIFNIMLAARDPIRNSYLVLVHDERQRPWSISHRYAASSSPQTIVNSDCLSPNLRYCRPRSNILSFKVSIAILRPGFVVIPTHISALSSRKHLGNTAGGALLLPPANAASLDRPKIQTLHNKGRGEWRHPSGALNSESLAARPHCPHRCGAQHHPQHHQHQCPAMGHEHHALSLTLLCLRGQGRGGPISIIGPREKARSLWVYQRLQHANVTVPQSREQTSGLLF